MKYLYAASIQGIQDFIFGTNKLREIAGASELVKQICTSKFKEQFSKEGKKYEEAQLLIGAAGKIKYLFKNKDLCEQLVKNFPFEIAKIAPGITISQTVIKIEEGEINEKHIGDAEEQLKIQRNLPTMPSTMAWMIAKRVPKTGLAVVANTNNDFIDISTQKKLDFNAVSKESLFKTIIPNDFHAVMKENQHQFANEFDDIVKDENSWLAVIHADGNSLGQIIPNLFKEIEGDAFVAKQREFSEKLNECTQKAAQRATHILLEKLDIRKDHNNPIPMRPIVCGGDDLTVIVPASIALEFTETFLREFSSITKEDFPKDEWKGINNGLTACAGIAFITKKYPIHYGMGLAESLCKQAKTEAKKSGIEPTPSCLSFYKMESSFARDYKKIRENELRSPHVAKMSLCPYYLDGENDQSITSLKKWLQEANEKPYVITRLRNVLSMLHTHSEDAIKMELERIDYINFVELKKFNIDKSDIQSLAHLHDLLSLNSFQK